MNFERMLAFVAVLLMVLSGLAAGSEQQLTGVISDSMCGAKHMAKDKSPAECTRMCVKQGMKYALVAGDKVYALEGHEAELDKFAGSRATIKGTMAGDTVTVKFSCARKVGTRKSNVTQSSISGSGDA